MPRDTPRQALLMELEQRIAFDGAGAVQIEERAGARDATPEPAHEQNTDALVKALWQADHLLRANQQTGQDNDKTAKQIVFIDTAVADAKELVSGLSGDVQVFVLNKDIDGIKQIAEILKGFRNVEAIHIVSHGSEGSLTLGSATLTAETMANDYAGSLQGLRASLSEQADILIYGCDFAAGEAGTQAAQMMAHLTGADVAASTDSTGNARLGGDWELEYRSGAIETDLALSMETRAHYQHLLAASAPVVDLNSGTTYADGISNGGFASGTTGWVASGAGAGSIITGGYAWTADNSSATLTQSNISGWNEGLAPSGAAQLTFDFGWNNGTPDTLTPATLEISVGGVIYARITTGIFLGASNTATISYLNGASGSPASVAASSYAAWTKTAITINLPNTVVATGDLVFNYQNLPQLIGLLPGYDDMFIDNVSMLKRVDAEAGVNFSTTYTENGPAVSIADTDSEVRDFDSTSMHSATIVLTNASSGDVLNVGNLPSGISASVNTAVAGQITVTLTGTASKADYTTAIRAISFSNSGDNPSTTPRIINVTVNDGGLTSAIAVSTINVTAVNDAPVNVLPGAGWTTLEDTAVVLGGLSVIDPDSGSGNISVSLSVTAGVLTAASGGGVTVTGSGTSTLALSGTLSAINAYLASSAAPLYTPLADANGTVSLTMLTNDGGNSGTGGALTDTDVRTISITAVNDAPVLDLNGSTAGTGHTASYVENGLGVAIAAASVSVTDVDSPNMTGASVVISNGQAGDILSVSGSLPAGINASWNAATFTLTLTGSATKAAYNTALTQILYASSSDTPSTTARTINVTVSDGALNSNTAVSTISVTAVNDAPVNTLPSTYTTSEDTNLGLTGILIADPDAGSGAMTVTLSVTSGSLSAISAGGVTVTGSGTTALSLSGTLANINAYLAGSSRPTFTPVADFNGTVTLTMLTSDNGNSGSGGIMTDTDVATITVTAVDDAPVIDLDASGSGTGWTTSYTENGTGIGIADSDRTITDIDSATMAFMTVAITNGQAGDILSATGLPAGITAAWDPATYTLTLSGTASRAAYEAALDQVRFASASENPSTTPRSVAVIVNDGTLSSNTAVTTINVIAVNDAPINSLPGGWSTNEDVAVSLTGITVNDPDGNGTVATVTLSVPSGSISASSGAGVSVSGSGTGTLVLSGTLTAINAYLASASAPLYTPVADFNGSVTLTVTSSDGTATDTDIAVISIAAVADIVADSVATNEDTPVTFNVLTGVFADNFENSGRIVTSVTQPPAGEGTVTFLADGTLVYTPAVNFSGTTIFTYTVTSGGVTETANVTVTVNSVNDAPVNTLPTSGWTTGEDVSIALSGLAIADVDAGSGNMTVTLSVAAGALAATSGGGVVVNGSGTQSITLSGTLAAINAFLASASAPIFTPAQDATGTVVLTMSTSDNGNTGSGGALTDVDTRNITITAVNDAPVNTLPSTYTTNEDTNLGLTGILIADPDAGSGAMTVTFSVTSGSLSAISAGGVTVTGSGTTALSLSGTLANINAYLAGSSRPTFTPVADFNGTVTLTMLTSDNGNSGSGGIMTDTDVATITVTAVDDAPVIDLDASGSGTGWTTSYTENGTGIGIADSDRTITDIDSATMAFMTVAITNGQAGDILSATGLPAGITAAWDPATYTLTLSGTASRAAYEAALDQVRFASTSENPSTTPRSVAVIVNDGTLSSNTAVTTINVIAINDAPINSLPGGWSTNEDVAVSLTGITVNDPDGNGTVATVTLSVPSGSISASSGAGVSVSGSSTGTLVLSGTLTAINAYLASASAPLYTPVADFNGSVTLTVTSSDGTATDTDTAVISIAAVADIVTDSVATNEDVALIIDAMANDGFTGAGRAITAIDGMQVSANSLVTVANGTVMVNPNGTLTFTPSPDYNGNTSFTYTVTSGGVTETATVNVNVIAVDDTPVNTLPGTQPAVEDTAVAITGVSVANADGGVLTTVLSVTSGTLTVAPGGGVTVVGNNSGTLTLAGTAADLNAVLASLTFQGAADYNGQAQLSMVTAHGMLSDTDVLTINIAAVADITSDAVSTNEDTPLTFNVITGTNGASADSFQDSGRQLTAVTQPPAGQGTVTFSADGTVVYTPASDFNGTTSFTYTVTAGGVTETATVTVTVNPANDAPVNGLPGTQTIAEDSTLIFTPSGNNALTVRDVDGDTLSVTISVTNGTFSLAGLTGLSFTTGDGTADGTMSFSGTAAAINAALAGASFSPTSDFNGTAQLTFTTSDGVATDSDMLSIVILPGADIANDNAVADEDTAVTINVFSNDSFENPGRTITAIDGQPILANGPSIAVADGTVRLNASGQLIFTPATGFNGLASFTYTVTSGGVDETATVSVAVASVNTPPTNTLPSSFTTLEDTALSLAGLQISDADAGLGSVSVTLAVDAGTLTAVASGTVSVNGSGTNAITLSGTLADINAYLSGNSRPSFMPSLDATGNVTLTMTTSDNGNTGGIALSDIDTATITITPVNDAPSGSDRTIVIDEDASYTFSLADFPLSDPKDTPANTLSAIVITTLPAAGTLTLNGAAVVAGQVITAANITGLTYHPAAEATGNAAATFTFQVRDNGGATSGGIDTDPSAKTITFNITAINDAPVNTLPTIFGTNEDTALALTGLQVADSDSAGGTLTISLTVDSGMLSATSGAGVLITGSGTATLVLSGTLADLNLYLASASAPVFTPSLDFSGSVALTMVTNDNGYTGGGNALTDTDVATISVASINDAPVGSGTAIVVVEDVPFTGNLPSATDSDGDTLTYGPGTVAPLHGVVSIAADGSYSYTPRANYNGSDSFSFIVGDGIASVEYTVTVTVTAVNDAPIAMSDDAQTNAATAISFNVLANDTDADGDVLTVSQVGGTAGNIGQTLNGSAGGVFIIQANGDVSFDPAGAFADLVAGAQRTTTITYQISDGHGGVTNASLTITVIGGNDAPVSTPITNQTSDDAASVSLDLSGHFSDPDNPDTLSFAATGLPTGLSLDPASGIVSGTVDRSASQSGPYLVAITATDAAGLQTTRTFTWTIVNPAPIAVNDSVTASDNAILTGSVLSANGGAADHDPDGDPISVSAIGANPAAVGVSVRGTNGGSFTIAADGSFTFNPGTDFKSLAAGQSAVTTMSYTISDGQGGSATALLSVTVNGTNDGPVATADNFVTNEDTPVTFDVRSNDSDADGDPLVVTHIDGQPISQGNSVNLSVGSVTLNSDGTLTFMPAADYHGTPSFSYTISDGQGGTATGTVSGTVNAVDDAPVANDDSFVTDEDTPITFDVRSNDSDVDGDPLSITQINGSPVLPGGSVVVSGGTVTLNADWTLTFNPTPDYNGTPSFSYTLSDGKGGTAVAIVNGTVTSVADAPTVNADSFTTMEDSPATINVLANDRDGDGDLLTITAINGNAIVPGGTVSFGGHNVTLNLDGTLTFAPAANANGPVSFSYTVSDGAMTSVATVSGIITAVNDAPTSVDDSFTTAEDTAINLDVIANDADIEGDTIAVTQINGSNIAPGGTLAVTNGTVTLELDGTLTFTPAANFHGMISFTYTVSDGRGGASSAVVWGTVTAANDNPVANADSFTTLEDTIATFDVRTNDTDADGDTLLVSAINNTPIAVGQIIAVAGGTITLNADGTLTFAPTANSTLAPSFTYTVSDGQGGSATGTVTGSITPVNDLPTAADATVTTPEDTVLSDQLPAAADADGDTVVYSAGSIVAAHGTVTINANGSYTYTPAADFHGTDLFSFIVDDGNGGRNEYRVTVIVTDQNDAPSGSALPSRTANDGDVLSFDLSSYFSDAEGDSLTYSQTGLPAGLSISATGTIFGTVAANASQGGPGSNGSYTVTISVDDGNGGTASQTFTFTVSNPPPVAVDDTATVIEDGSVSLNVLDGTASNGVADSDPDGDMLSVVSATANHGSVLIGTNGNITYNPAPNFNGTDTIVYTISDGNGGTATGVVTVTVQPDNDSPTAGTISDRQRFDGATDSIDVSAFFLDADGDVLTYSATDLPPGLSIDPTTGIISGTILHDASGATGEHIYMVVVSANDGHNPPTTIGFRYTVLNPPPDAADDSISTVEDTAVEIDVLQNDGDPDGDALTVIRVNNTVLTVGGASVATANGRVELVLNGSGDPVLLFTPNANYNGQESFTYTIEDENGGVDTATVSIVVTPDNDGPTTVGQIPNMMRSDGQTLNFDASSYFRDVDGDVLNFTISGLPVGLSFDPATGRISGTIDPNASQNAPSGVYAVTINAYDRPGGTGLNVSQSFNLTISSIAPSATDDAVTTPEDTAVTFNVLDGSASGGVPDTDPGNSALQVVSATANHGSVTFNANGVLTYTPNANFNGTDTIIYTIANGSNVQATGTVTVTVTPENDAPVSTPMTDLQRNDGDVVIIDLAGHFSDPENDTLTFAASGLPLGLQIDPATGRIYGTIDAGASGPTGSMPYMVSVTATDSHGDASAPATFVLVVRNLAPDAQNDTAATTEDTPVEIDILANDNDPDGDTDEVIFVNNVALTLNGPSVATANGSVQLVLSSGKHVLRFTPNSNYFGVESFVYTVNDGNGGIDTATVTVTVTAVNDDPVAGTIAGRSAAAGDAVNFSIATAFSDPDGDTLNFVVSNLPPGLNYDPLTGTISGTVTTAAALGSPYTVSVTAYDGANATGSSVTTSFTFTVNNIGPVAQNDTVSTTEDTPVNFDPILGIGTISGNGGADSDPEGDSLSVSAINGTPVAPGSTVAVNNGTISVEMDGTLTFTPTANFHGVSVINYQISDGRGGLANATITVTVDAVNDAPSVDLDSGSPGFDFSANFVEGGGAVAVAAASATIVDVENGAVRLDVALGGFVDGGNEVLSLGATTQIPYGTPKSGTIVVGSSTFAYSYDGNNTLSFEAVVNGDTLANGDLTALLRRMTYEDQGANPTSGNRTLTFTVVDVDGSSSTPAVSTISVGGVNTAPVAVDDTVSTTENTVVTSMAPGILANDGDAENDALTVVAVNGTALGGGVTGSGGGSFVINADGSYSFDPQTDFDSLKAGETRTTSVSYTIEDTAGAQSIATFTVTVTGENDAPVGAAGNIVVVEDTVATGPLPAATDVDGDTITYAVVSQPANGSVAIDINGNYSYTPAPDYNGSDSFTYSISDGTTSVTYTVMVSVNADGDAPVATNMPNQAYHDGETISLDISGYFSDPDGGTLTFIETGLPPGLTMATNGHITGIVDTSASQLTGGSYTVTVTATDIDGNDANATFTITVTNPPPVARNDDLSTTETHAISGSVFADNGHGADTDPDGDTISVATVGGQTLNVGSAVSGSQGGMFIVNSDGTFSFNPGADFINLADGASRASSIAYSISDGEGGTSSATLTVVVTGGNDAPVAGSTAIIVTEDTPYSSTLPAASDNDGDAVTYSVASQPTHGFVSINADGTYVYTPGADFYGADSFDYTVSDGLASSTYTVSVTVTAVNDVPVGTATTITVIEDTPTVGTLPTGFDADGDVLTFSPGTLPNHGTLVLDSAGNYTYTPTANYHGPDSFTYILSDGTTSTTVTVTVNVTDGNDPPTAVDDTATTDRKTTTSGNVILAGAGRDNDPDGDTLVVVAINGAAGQVGNMVTGTAGGTFTVAADGSYSFDPGSAFDDLGAGMTRNTSVAYTISDGNGGMDSATLTITVTGLNREPTAQPLNSISDRPNAAILLDISSFFADADGDALNYTINNLPAGLGYDATTGIISGTISPAAAGPGGTQVYTVTVTASDGNGGSITSSFNWTISGTAPDARNDAFTGGENTTLTGSVAVNNGSGADSDPDGDTLTYSVLSGPSSGTLTLQTDGSFTYVPNAGFHGIDSFTYQVDDGHGGTDSAIATITITSGNHAPDLQADTFSVAEGGSTIIAVLANDTDPDGNPLTITEINGTGILPGGTVAITGGSVTLNADKTLTFQATSGFSGGVSFSYTASDGTVSDQATVTGTVGAVNDPPVNTLPQSFTTLEDTALPLSGLSIFDPDAGSGNVTITLHVDAGMLAAVNSGGVTVTGSGTGTIVLSGTIPNLNAYLGSSDVPVFTPAPNNTNAVTLTVTTNDAGLTGTGGPAQDIDTVTIFIQPANDAPTAGTTSVTTLEDQPVAGSVAATDVDGDPLTFTLDGQPSNGTVHLNLDGTFLYTPNSGYVGSDGFAVLVEDGHGGSVVASVSVSVGGANHAPTAADAAITVQEDTVFNGNLPTATDIDGDAVVYSLSQAAAHGVVIIRADGSYSYTPNPDFSGNDSFNYAISDGTATVIYTITITVQPQNDIPDGNDLAITLAEDTVFNGTLPAATDPDGNTLIYSLAQNSEHGIAVVNANGTFTYTPFHNFNGSDGFIFAVSDGTITVYHHVSIDVTAVNDVPVGPSIALTTAIDTAVSGHVAATDADGDVLTYNPGTLMPANGTVTLGANGTFTYTPDLGFNGTDSFEVTVDDGAGGVLTVTITISVGSTNQPPVGSDDSIVAIEDTLFSGSLPGASDNDGDALVYNLGTPAAHGTVVINANGTYTYTPDLNFNGPDQFTYTVTDNVATTAYVVSIDVTPVNDDPVGRDLVAFVLRARFFSGTLPAAFDPDGDTLTYWLDTPPSHGTVTIQTNGTYNYRPNAHFVGMDSFTYLVNDGTTSVSYTAWMNVMVANTAPDAQNLSVGTQVNTTVHGQVNATDADGDPLHYQLVTGPTHGTVIVNTDGTFAFTPQGGFIGSDSFTVRVDDGMGGQDLATVTVNVSATPTGGNHAPVGSDDTLSLNKNNLYIGRVPVATDADGDSLSYAIHSSATHGTVTMQADGTYTYRPNIDFVGIDHFTYTVTDGRATVTYTVTVNVLDPAGGNHPPVGRDDVITVLEDSRYAGRLPVATDVDGDRLTYGLGSQAAHGIVTIQADGTYTYVPAHDFFGTDSFRYSVSDGKTTVFYTVTVNVNEDKDDVGNDNHAPVASDDQIRISENSRYFGHLPSAFDADGDRLVYGLGSPAENGRVTVHADGTYSYVPARDFFGTDSFRYTVSDGKTTVTYTITILVVRVDGNHTPTSDDRVITLRMDQDFQGKVTAEDFDGDALTFALTSSTLHGHLEFQPDGSFIYHPDKGFSGIDRFSYVVSDGLSSTIATVTIRVGGPLDRSETEILADPQDPHRWPSFIARTVEFGAVNFDADASRIIDRTVNRLSDLGSAGDVDGPSAISDVVHRADQLKSTADRFEAETEPFFKGGSAVRDGAADGIFVADVSFNRGVMYLMLSTTGQGAAGHAIVDFRVTLADGRALPVWLTTTAQGLLVGTPPVGVETLDLAIHAQSEQGMITQTISVDVLTGEVTTETVQRSERNGALFSQQLAMELNGTDDAISALARALSAF